jgi:hypothetical protein
MDHNDDSVLENFHRVHRGEVTNVSFSHANVVMLSREHYHNLHATLEGVVEQCARDMCERDALLARNHLLCEALENMLGVFDSPLARRRMPGDFAAEVIRVARAASQQESEHE